MNPIRAIARIFASKQNRARIDLLPEEAPANPVADQHNGHKRVTMAVDALHHQLHLTLPPKPGDAKGEQGFAVIHTAHTPDHEAVTSRLGAFPGRVAARVWHNGDGEDADAPGHAPGRYISLRGDANAIKHIVNRAGVAHAVAHSSENVLS